MSRYLIAAGICLGLTHLLSAAEPPKNLTGPRQVGHLATLPSDSTAEPPRAQAADATLASTTFGRKGLESLLQSPAKLDFGGRETVTIKELLDQLHERHQLSVRFDVPTLSAMYGVSRSSPSNSQVTACRESCVSGPLMDAVSGMSAGKLIAEAIGIATPPACSCSNKYPAVVGVTTASASIDQLVPAAPPAPACPASAVAAASSPPSPIAKATEAPKSGPASQPTADLKPAPAVARLPKHQPSAAPAGFPAPLVIPNGEATEASPVAPLAPPPLQPPAAEPVDGPHDFLSDALKTEIDIQTIDLGRVSIGTALRHALEALPTSDLGEEASGLPIALTNAGMLDYVVEDDGLLITSRMKALTYKETRVYSVKHLKDVKPEQLAAVIRQSIRPWSWRSRIDDLGEQLRVGGPRIPSKALATIFKSSVQLASSETGIEVNASDAPAEKPAAKLDAQTLDAQEMAMLGDALVNGLVTFVHTTLTTLEIMHYADPPTGSIQTLPGKLIITQSQAAHREIAELLKQLAEE
jgi:hypothetical protein